MSSMLDQLQNTIGYRFKDTALLNDALTHSSAAGTRSYERLEFLGDRVLGVVVAEMLYETFPDEAEGDLAKRFSALVQGTFLAKRAIEIRLGTYIIFSDAERNAGGAENAHILADVFEAIVGALYLDGGLERCKAFIAPLWQDHIFTTKAPPMHPKTELQEWAQAKGLPLPLYEIAGQSGPDHAPVFDIKLSVEGYEPMIVQGRSRQDAEKKAAKQFIDLLKDNM